MFGHRSFDSSLQALKERDMVLCRPWKLVLPADKREEWSKRILSESYDPCNTPDSKREEEPIIEAKLVRGVGTNQHDSEECVIYRLH